MHTLAHPRSLPSRAAHPAWLGTAAGLALLGALLLWGSAPVALLSGALFAWILPGRLPQGLQRSSSRLLQACVVLLGFSMDLPSVVRLGLQGSGFAFVSIAATLALGTFLARKLRVEKVTGLLVSVGTAICGGSAIAAASSVIAATESQIAVAIGSVFVLNAVALYTFPLIGHALHLSQGQFGLWAGIAIHDVSSVVGAGLSYGPAALQSATAIKLARSLWIVPVTLSLSFMGEAAQPRRTGLGNFPWFILLFVAASLARSSLHPIARLSPVAAELAHRGMIGVLFLIGASLSVSALKRVGWRSLALGFVLWIGVSAASLTAILKLHLAA